MLQLIKIGQTLADTFFANFHQLSDDRRCHGIVRIVPANQGQFIQGDGHKFVVNFELQLRV